MPLAPDSPKPRCKATKSTTGEPCPNFPIQGGDVCRWHGGAAPQVKAAAARRLAAAKLRTRTDKAVDKLLAELEIDAADRGPTEILLDIVYRCYAMVQLLGAVVGELTVPITDSAADTTPGSLHSDGKPHVAVDMYSQALERAARASKLALDAGVDQRMVEIEQDKGRLIAKVIAAVIDDPDLGLSEEQRRTGRAAAATQLRLIVGGAA